MMGNKSTKDTTISQPETTTVYHISNRMGGADILWWPIGYDICTDENEARKELTRLRKNDPHEEYTLISCTRETKTGSVIRKKIC